MASFLSRISHAAAAHQQPTPARASRCTRTEPPATARQRASVTGKRRASERAPPCCSPHPSGTQRPQEARRRSFTAHSTEVRSHRGRVASSEYGYSFLVHYHRKRTPYPRVQDASSSSLCDPAENSVCDCQSLPCPGDCSSHLSRHSWTGRSRKIFFRRLVFPAGHGIATARRSAENLDPPQL